MSELLQFIIVVGFGALCFGCGFLTSFIVTRKHWRGEMLYGYHASQVLQSIIRILHQLYCGCC